MQLYEHETTGMAGLQTKGKEGWRLVTVVNSTCVWERPYVAPVPACPSCHYPLTLNSHDDEACDYRLHPDRHPDLEDPRTPFQTVSALVGDAIEAGMESARRGPR